MKKASVFAPSTQIQIFSKPHSFYPDSCCRGLKPPWRAVSKRCALSGGFTGFVNSLHSYISTLNRGEISSNYWEKFILAVLHTKHISLTVVFVVEIPDVDHNGLRISKVPDHKAENKVVDLGKKSPPLLLSPNT